MEEAVSWFREYLSLLAGSIGLIAFVILGVFSVHEWLSDDARYLRDGAFALFFLCLGLAQLWQWRQRQVRM